MSAPNLENNCRSALPLSLLRRSFRHGDFCETVSHTHDGHMPFRLNVKWNDCMCYIVDIRGKLTAGLASGLRGSPPPPALLSFIHLSGP
jgi:hypothetical protein